MEAPSQRALEMRERLKSNPAAMKFKDRFEQKATAVEAIGCAGCGGGRGCCEVVTLPTPDEGVEFVIPKVNSDAKEVRAESINGFSIVRDVNLRLRRPENDEDEDEEETDSFGNKKNKNKKRKI